MFKALAILLVSVNLACFAQVQKDVAGFKAGYIIYVERAGHNIDSLQAITKDELLSYDLIKMTCTGLKMDFSFLHSLYFTERIDVKTDKSADMYDTDGLYLMVYYSDTSQIRAESFLDRHLKNWQNIAQNEFHEKISTDLAIAKEDLLALNHVKDSLVKNPGITPPNPSEKSMSKTDVTDKKISETEARIADMEKMKLIRLKKYELIKKIKTEKTVISRFI
ncbi:MAG: hypothetical protein A2W91_08130 [Bacteroidetes bacterium GWF2_38_335]|nr:MAG: hypothetical protein A2W91_08130 [Bacteroidetes bacterium GWF2_38_335]OFY78988.1 MAG: hypothetical protein A2281_02590 [Bacteroidetes bacterium RIFOXYA12_FULL_38_20]HBS86059.1 hypothetical protein [Bacteroidales bacterium]